MRRIRYAVAMSLDGYIAGPNGEYDWIIKDPDIDFAEIFGQFDTFLIGRHTFELMNRQGRGSMPGMRLIVFSRTLRTEDFPDVTVVAEKPEEVLAGIRSQAGKAIWLFGGGSLFRRLLEVRLVDTVEVAVIPVLLGGGIPMLPPPAQRARLRLTGNKVYKTGIVRLEYAIEYGKARSGAGRKRSR
jgi:dihydrofolate reductase